MLVIRQAQMSVLQQDIAARFDRSLTEHLQHFAPHESHALGKDALLAIARQGRQRAEHFGLLDRESIRLYVELMFLFGSGFSTDPQYPWAAQTLADETGTQRQRSVALHSAAIHYLHTVFGAKREFLRSALKRLLEHRLGDFRNGGSCPESLVQKLDTIFPEKCAYLGQDRVLTLIQSAARVAGQHGLIETPGPALLTIWMFLLGHEADRDPAIPWLEALLQETAYMDSSIRIKTLETRTWEELRNGMGRFT